MPWRLIYHRVHLPIGALVFGLVIGITSGLLFANALFSKSPTTQMAPKQRTFTVNGRTLETRYRFVRRLQCNSVSATWVWKWIDEGTGEKKRYFVPIYTSHVSLSDVSPVIQEFTVAIPLPAAVTPGNWFVRYKVLDYCRAFAWVIGPTIRVSEDQAVTVPDPAP